MTHATTPKGQGYPLPIHTYLRPEAVSQRTGRRRSSRFKRNAAYQSGTLGGTLANPNGTPGGTLASEAVLWAVRWLSSVPISVRQAPKMSLFTRT